MSEQEINRRELLALGVGVGGLGLLASCTPAAKVEVKVGTLSEFTNAVPNQTGSYKFASFPDPSGNNWRFVVVRTATKASGGIDAGGGVFLLGLSMICSHRTAAVRPETETTAPFNNSGTITCQAHQATFDAQTGINTNTQTCKGLQTIPLVVRGNEIFAIQPSKDDPCQSG